MTKNEAVTKALAYVQAIALDVGPVVEAQYLDLSHLDKHGKDCPEDLLETYDNVRKNFRNQWVVSFKVNDVAGQFSSPETQIVCVFDSGKTMLFSSP